MSDASELIETMMHYIGKATGPLRLIDRDTKDLSEDTIHGGKAFSYLLYNVEVVKNVLDQVGVTGLSPDEIKDLMELDLSENLDRLMQIGAAAGREYVKGAHLPVGFDLVC